MQQYYIIYTKYEINAHLLTITGNLSANITLIFTCMQLPYLFSCLSTRSKKKKPYNIAFKK